MVKWTGLGSSKSQRSGSNRRLNFLVNERFQWRYTSYLVLAVILATLLTGGVTAYFLNQNYGIFTRLAYLHAPDLLPQLEREQVWINTFLVAFFITLVSFNFFYGLKITSRIAGPIVILKRHIRTVSRGMFSNPALRVRESDEFKDLIESYNYLFKSLQAQVRRDIKYLTHALDQNDMGKARETLLQILEEKKSQLKSADNQAIATSATSESSAPTPSSRRVS
jgi:hypothetical protein